MPDVKHFVHQCLEDRETEGIMTYLRKKKTLLTYFIYLDAFDATGSVKTNTIWFLLYVQVFML